jgi:hypothetical protein
LFFPFVEPGLEVDMRWQGDEEKSREGKWLEICGCGMVHPKVLENCGIDPNEWQGFAFGFGVERMTMFAFQIYIDFSSYTDIARGAAQVMGIKLMKNFDRPYFASTLLTFSPFISTPPCSINLLASDLLLANPVSTNTSTMLVELAVLVGISSGIPFSVITLVK